MNAEPKDFKAALHAQGPDAERAIPLQLYGRFVGDWDADVIGHGPDGTIHRASGEIHFGWILEGRAIQDVWMVLPLAERKGAASFPVAGNWYGTTIRAYDPTIEAWRIYWMDPATNSYRQQIGRQRGPDIVQEGTTEAGGLSRWSFTEIVPDSFHWLGEAKPAGQENWRLVVEVQARRQASRSS
jgi:hypothetical protein